MHTFEWFDPEILSHKSGSEVDERTVFVHHNGDWSGDAIINIPADMVKIDVGEPGSSAGVYGGGHRAVHVMRVVQRIEIRLPGKLLAAISRQATIRDIVGTIEDMA